MCAVNPRTRLVEHPLDAPRVGLLPHNSMLRVLGLVHATMEAYTSYQWYRAKLSPRRRALSLGQAVTPCVLTINKHQLIRCPCTARPRPKTESSRRWGTPAAGRSSSR